MSRMIVLSFYVTGIFNSLNPYKNTMMLICPQFIGEEIEPQK
jgi:hypothetical protein